MAVRLIENFRALFYAPFYAAVATGAYQKAGVEVEFLSSSSPLEAASALREGRADVMWGGPLRVLLSLQENPESDFVCFCNAVARDPFFVIGRREVPGFKVHDLEGRVFASVSEVPTPWLCLQDDLRRDYLDPRKVKRRTGLSMAAQVQGLMNGELEAIQVFQPYAEEVLRSGAGHLWYAQASRGLTAYTTLVTRRGVLVERREEMLGMVRAMASALRWMRGTEAGEIAEVLRPWFPGVRPEIFAGAIARYQALDLWAETPVLEREGFERLHGAMRSGGVLHRDIAFEACVDNGLAELVANT